MLVDKIQTRISIPQQHLKQNISISSYVNNPLSGQLKMNQVPLQVKSVTESKAQNWCLTLAPRKFEWNFKYVIFKQILVIDRWSSLVKLP